MVFAVASTAARSIGRSSSVRNAAARFASHGKSARSPFLLPNRSSVAHRIFRCPTEMSACLESMQPFHTATASALMTSMLTVSRCGYGWLPEACSDELAMMIYDQYHPARAQARSLYVLSDLVEH